MKKIQNKERTKKQPLHPDLLLGVALLVFILGLTTFTTILISREQSQITACTQEARICPDGSVTTRTGKYCSFSPCLRDALPLYPGITEEPFTVPLP